MLNIERLNFWLGDETPHYFHPAICRAANDWLMTLQTFNGAGDTYGPVIFSVSDDEGHSWSVPEAIPALRTNDLKNGIAEGIADVRPFYHPQTESVIAIGCNTYYGVAKQVIEDPDFDTDKYRQFPVYAVRKANGRWLERKELSHPFFAECNIWRVACPQLVILPDGDLIIPIYFKLCSTEESYSVCTIRCSYSDSELKVKHVGTPLHLDHGRGLLEPSVVQYKNIFYLTIRAEDGCGYLATSTDGLNWGAPTPWQWDDKTNIDLSSTQQHWLSINDKLLLIYTRKDDANHDVMRWRSPLFMAEFDAANNCLLKSTEQIVFPLQRKDNIAYLMGNFHVSSITSDKSIISDAPLWFRIEKGATVEQDRIAEYESHVAVAIVTPN